jgi:hypothetical protein
MTDVRRWLGKRGAGVVVSMVQEVDHAFACGVSAFGLSVRRADVGERIDGRNDRSERSFVHQGSQR